MLHVFVSSLDLTSNTSTVTCGKQKVDQQREDLDSRISELHLKIEEIPRALATLQDTRRSNNTDAFTFRTADDKLSLQSHLLRTGEGSFRTGSNAPYTDLAPFTIPDDMRAKVEARIRERELVQSAEQARAELAEAYRRLQLAAGGNPRIGELRLQVDQCQEEIKRAFSLIRTSNLQLYACCEAKAERLDMAAMQRELQLLRDRLKAVENGGGGSSSSSPLKTSIKSDQGGSTVNAIHQLSSLLIMGENNPKSNNKGGANVVVMDGRALQVTNAQVPELRVSLLEFSRNLNLLKHRWKKRKWTNGSGNGGGNVNPLVLTHLNKLVAMLNDAYSSTAEEPVDLAAVSRHVDKVARVLGSDFSVQILSLLGGCGADRDAEDMDTNSILQLQASSASVTTPMGGARDLARALCRYSDAFTDVFFRNEAENKAVAGAAIEQCAQTTRSLDRVAQDVGELARKQAALEDALLTVKAAMNVSPYPSSPTPKTQDPAEPTGDLHRMSSELQQLKRCVGEMNKTFATEQALHEVRRQLEQCRQALERPLSSSRTQLALSLQSPLSIAAPPTSISIVRRRSAEGTTDVALAALVLDPGDERLRSQPKLDPLQVHKMTGKPRPGRTPSAATLNARWNTNASGSPSGAAIPTGIGGGGVGANTALGKIQMRSQMMRPRSNRQQRGGA